jgi:hypothetical protein
MTAGSYEEWLDFLIADTGGEDVILGLPWLRKVNPSFDWAQGLVYLRPKTDTPQALPPPPHCTVVEEVRATRPRTTVEEIPENPHHASSSLDDETLEEELSPGPEDEQPPLQRICANRRLRRRWLRLGIIEDPKEEVWCAAGFTYSQKIAEEVNKQKQAKPLEEIIPERYRDKYSKVFSEQESERLPEHKPYDHTIDFVPGASTNIRTKIYPMSLSEQAELDTFLEENLAKGYIQHSKSSIASPVFFIKKKDGKLRFVQDYRVE